MIARISFFEPADTLVNLPQNLLSRKSAAGAKAPIIAERTAANRDRSVHVWAGKTRVDAYFLHPVPE